MSNLSLSVVILAKNEELNIQACLESISGWTREIIVVDDESLDRTSEIAHRFTGKIFRRKMINEGEQRNWGYSQAAGDWILSLDADERVSPELKEEIERVLIYPADYQAFDIPFRNYIGEYLVRYCGWYPASKVRLFQKGRARYEEVNVHPRLFVDGKVGHLTKDIIHKGHRDFGHFLEKVNRQTDREAQKWMDSGQEVPVGKIARRTVDRFFRSYIGKKGFKDGWVGFMVAYFASFYQIMSYAKYREMKALKQSSVGGEQ